MNLREAQETVMPWGAHSGKTLLRIARDDPKYITLFLAEDIRARLDAWLGEAVDLMVAEGMPTTAIDPGQGELF